MPSIVPLLNLTQDRLEDFVTQELGEPRFRAGQLWQWIWGKGARDFGQMTNLSHSLREKLAEAASLAWPEVAVERVSADGTIKFLLVLSDGERIETVLIPGARGRYTQCLSTQVGCPMACTFCNTGLLGFTRNLTHGEILGQVLVGRAYLAAHSLAPLRNIVFMGMGEPLLNLTNVLDALRSMNSDTGLNLSWRRSTISTVGLPGPLEELGRSELALPAISLHAPTQELRARIMPKAARVPLPELMAALERFPLRPRERITFEYLLLKGVNDTLKHADQLASLLLRRQGRHKVNLIRYNTTLDIPYEAPEQERAEAFEHRLWDRGLTATIRRSMGQDIEAACGQLRAQCPPPR